MSDDNNNVENSLINNTNPNRVLNTKSKPLKNKIATNGKLAKAAGPAIFWIAVIVVCLIILIGIILFLVTMPGMVMDKMKTIGKAVINSLLSTFGTDDSTFVDNKQIYNALDYLEEMGYDLKGYGFLTDYVKNEESGVKKELDSESGEERIVEAYSDFIKRYIIADNYIYIIKNKNLSTNWLDALWQNIKNVFGASYSQNSTRGLLAIYEETGIGKADENNLFANLGAMSVDTDKKILYLQKGGNPKIAYNLDGWIGRYGMPLEFLLSIHVATMMPDLAFDMADTFDTNVNIYLRNDEASLSENSSFDAYLPYIASVTNHWYRNVYYVVDLSKMNTENQDENQSIVSYNYDYERLYGDRWTLYETYNDDDVDGSDYTEYANENYGEFKLYVLSSDGKYATSSTILEDDKQNSKVFQDKKYSEYYIYTGTKNEANDENINVSKKAVTLTTDEEFQDIGWNDLGGNIWSAYLETESMHYGNNVGSKTYFKRYNSDTAGTITQTGEGQRGETNSKIKKMFLVNTYFRYDGSVQTAEIITALRNKIKKDKISSDYISYGALNSLHNNSGDTIDLTNEDIEYSAQELGLDEKEFTGSYNLKDYSGQVSLTQDSLNAFSMLENIHTLDADYIYRDFKELVVELGYFSKEELTNQITDVLGWIIPDVSSLETYPERLIDKPETEFGTLIHSKGDVLASRYMELDSGGYKKDRESLSKQNISNPESLFAKSFNSKYGTVLTEGITADDFVEQIKKMWNFMSEVGYSADSSGCKTFEESKETNDYRLSRATFVSWALISLKTEFDNYCSSKCLDEVVTEGYKTDDEGNFLLNSKNEKIPNTRYKSIHRADDVAEVCVNRLCGKLITEFNDLQRGDIIAFTEGGVVTGLDVLGEKTDGSFTRYTAENGISKGAEPPHDFDENKFYGTACFGIRLFEGSEYNGYEGNEMVASPVTGILLEYGTYDSNMVDSITGEQYRVNTDLKYPYSLNNIDENVEKKIVSDKVGYAKILVLDKENYLYLEQSTSNKWNINEGGESLLTKNGKFREDIIDTDSSNALDMIRGSSRLSDFDQTIYAYKEFAEEYEELGIAGYVILIDGFACEMPDEGINVKTTFPNGEKITLDTYKQFTQDSTNGKSVSEIQSMQLPNEWRDDDLFLTQSEKVSHKFEAETRAKMRSYSSLYVDKVLNKDGSTAQGVDSLIFIKEGTILGRTITDKELLESSKYRNGSMGTYEENREFQEWKKADGKDKIIGNYIRIIMRDLDKTPVENVEKYFKDSKEVKFNWDELVFFSPFESGGTDFYQHGPASIGTLVPGQISVGLIQETDLQYPYWNSRPDSSIARFLFKCWLMDDDLCAKLHNYSDWTRDRFWGLAESDNLSFGASQHRGNYYVRDDCTVYLPIAGYTNGTPCLYDGGSPREFSRNRRVKWKGKVYDSFNDFIRSVSLISDGNECETIYILDDEDNVVDSGRLLFSVDGASLDSGRSSDNWFADKASGSVYTDATGYKLEESFRTYEGQPQREVDHSVYNGGDQKIAKDNLLTSELEDDLTYICDINREKFIRIQREAAKETYLDEIITYVNKSKGIDLSWIADRPAAVQGAIMTLPISGAEPYREWPPEYSELSDEELLDIIAEEKSKIKSITDNPATFEADPTKGTAFTVPEIAKKIISGAIKKYDLQDYLRYCNIDVLEAVGITYKDHGEK